MGRNHAARMGLHILISFMEELLMNKRNLFLLPIALLLGLALAFSCAPPDDDDDSPSAPATVAKPKAMVLEASANKVTLVSTEAVALQGTANSIGFKVKVGTKGSETERNVTAVAIKSGSSNKIVEVTFDGSAVTKGQSVLLSYATHATNYVSASAKATKKLVAFTDIAVENQVGQPSLSYAFNGMATKYTETAADDGTIDNTAFITVTLANADFLDDPNGATAGTKFVKDTHYTVSGLPAGLVMDVNREGAKKASIKFTAATATSHAAANSVIDASITWLAAAVKTADVTKNLQCY